jgi:mycothiol system anti-sigma-R factor
MAACTEQIALITSLVDGELDAANSALAEAHLSRCEGCREEYDGQQAIRALLAKPDVAYRAPETLKQRIAARPELSPGRRSTVRRVGSWLAPAATGAIAASAALLLLASPSQQPVLDQQLISSHVRSLQPGHLTDVETTNQHIVKPWFNGKIDFAPPVPELADQGFPLAGGRLDSIDGKTVAALIYHRRLHTVNLFVWRGDSSARTELEDGFAIAEWSEDGLRFAAVSDIPMADLREFEQLYRSRAGLG